MPSMSKREVSLVDQLMDRIRDYTVRRVPLPPACSDDPPASTDYLSVLEGELRDLLAADEVRVRVDGFARRTPGNGSPGGGSKGGRPMMVVPGEGGEDDERELVPTSSTEMAAFSEASTADPVHQLAVTAMGDLHTIERGLAALRVTLNRFAELRRVAGVSESGYCHVANRVHGLPWDPEWEKWRTTDFAGVLERPLPERVGVSRYVYWFTRNHKRVPTRDEMLRHLAEVAEQPAAPVTA